MIEDFLGPFSDHDSQENTQIQAGIDLIPVAASPSPPQQTQPRNSLSPACLDAEANSTTNINNNSTEANPKATDDPSAVNIKLSIQNGPKVSDQPLLISSI